MNYKLNKFGVFIDVSFDTPTLTYCMRYNCNQWKQLRSNVIKFTDDVNKSQSKKELIEYLEKQ